MPKRIFASGIGVLILVLASCARQNPGYGQAGPSRGHSAVSATPSRATPTPSHSPTRATLTSHPVPDEEAESPPPTATITAHPTLWERLAPGVEQSLIPYSRPGEEEAIVYLYALRLEPSEVTFQVHYDREQPSYVDEWLIKTGADIVLNAGFFSGNNTPVGRIVAGGDLFGFPLNYGARTIGVAGLFTVLGGEVELYAIGRSSYSPRGMRFDEAVESYPVLVLPGRQPVYPTETGERARRTVIGLDDQRRVIVLISDLPVFSLHELAEWLAASDLNLDSALNLDGGRSSGLVVSLPGEDRLIPSYVPLPIVIGIYMRGD